MRINVHAGHNPAGKVACGAVGLINESTENRRVKDEVIAQLQALGHTVYDCTENNGSGQTDVLKKIVSKCNQHAVGLDVSIHFNSAANDPSGNGNTTGVEAYVYSASSAAKPYAEKICQAIADLGFRNRGVKTSSTLYVLKHTVSPAVLIECCFVDDKDDVELYDYQKMAAAIVRGITGQTVQEPEETEPAAPGEETAVGSPKKLIRLVVASFYEDDYAEAAKQEAIAKGYKDAYLLIE